MRASILVLLLLLAACGKPRQPVVTVVAAAGERRPMTLQVQKVHETLRLTMATEAGISHLIEVAVTDGPDGWHGRLVTLPYDEWQVGAPPPKRGTSVTTSPARWVRGGGAGSRPAPKAGK